MFCFFVVFLLFGGLACFKSLRRCTLDDVALSCKRVWQARWRISLAVLRSSLVLAAHLRVCTVGVCGAVAVSRVLAVIVVPGCRCLGVCVCRPKFSPWGSASVGGFLAVWCFLISNYNYYYYSRFIGTMSADRCLSEALHRYG